MISRTLLLAAAACVLPLPVLAADMPYAGQHTRAIKALSDDDTAAFAGRGDGNGEGRRAERLSRPSALYSSSPGSSS